MSRPVDEFGPRPILSVRRLAQELLDHGALLNLRTRRLVLDIQAVRGVSKVTAFRAVGLARRMAVGRGVDVGEDQSDNEPAGSYRPRCSSRSGGSESLAWWAVVIPTKVATTLPPGLLPQQSTTQEICN